MTNSALHPQTITLGPPGPNLIADAWKTNSAHAKNIVYLHGGGQTRHSWASTARKMANLGWAGLAYDARGHGDSDWAGNGNYSVDALIGDLNRARRAVAPPSPVVVGASMGGITALIAQGEDPTMGQALVLIDVVPSFEIDGSSEVFDFLRTGADGFGDIAEAAAALAAYDPTRGEIAEERVARALRRRGDRLYWHWDPAFVSGPSTQHSPSSRPINTDLDRLRERARDAAAQVRVPVLLIRGSRSRVTGTSGAADLRALIPHAQHSEIADAGHVMTGTDNDRMCADLGRFLRSLDDAA